jgi:acetyl-CoA acetyltransferase
VLALQTDPYTVAPLMPDAVSMAGLQARLGLDAGKWTAEQMAQVALDSFAVAERLIWKSPSSQWSIDELLARPYFADPLRRHDIAPITDGASAIVLAAGDRARELRERPAWITGIEHRIETPILGARDLTTSPSTAASAAAATGGDAGSIDVAELYAPFTHQQLILTEAIGLGASTKVNPSGGALVANPMFSTGLEAHRLRGPKHLRRLRATGTGTRHQRGCPATESGRGHGGEVDHGRGPQKSGRRPRHRADQVRRQAQGRLDERSGPGSHR